MSQSKITRRGLLGTTAAAGGLSVVNGPWRHNRVWAQASDKPIRIGLTSDASGQYANSGASDRRGMIMAIDEANAKGGVLGRRIEHIHLDTETTPATGSRVAERMITREECGFLVGAVSSGVANAISQVAQKYGVIYMNTNSSSPSESGENCHRVKFVWDGNGTNFAKAAVKNSIDRFGKSWLLLTNDYVWGHDTAKATKALLAEYGGEVMEEILIRRAPAISVDAAARAAAEAGGGLGAIGGDDQKAFRQQVAQLGMGSNPAWINSQQDWPDVYGLPIDNLFGVWDDLVLQARPAGCRRVRQEVPGPLSDTQMRVPGNVFYNGYMATRELLAIERAGSANNIAVIKALEGTRCRLRPACSITMPGSMRTRIRSSRPSTSPRPIRSGPIRTGRPVRDPRHPAPDVVMDTGAAAACKLESYEATRPSTPDRQDRLQIVAGLVRHDRRPRGARTIMLDILPHILNGLTLGLLFALMALGFTLIVGVMEVINLAHGSLFALGAYFALTVIGAGWFSIPPSASGGSLSIEPLRDGALRRAGAGRHGGHGAGAVPQADLRQGAALRPAPDLRRGAGDRGDHPARLGRANRTSRCPRPSMARFSSPGSSTPSTVLRGRLQCRRDRGGVLFLEKTPYGAIIKAGAHDSEMVRALGYDLSRLRLLVFGFGAALAGLAGIIMVPIWGLRPHVGIDVVIPAFLIVIGGIGSFWRGGGRPHGGARCRHHRGLCAAPGRRCRCMSC